MRRIELRVDTENGEMVVAGAFREVVPEEKLVFTWAWEGDSSAESRDNHNDGWSGTLDKLSEFVS